MRVLIFGSSYGLLFAAMLLERGFGVDIFSTKAETDILNKHGFEIFCDDKLKKFNISENWRAIHQLDNSKYIFTTLAVQEPVLSKSTISESIKYLIKQKSIFLSIMNVPLYEFLINISPYSKIKNPEHIYHSLETTKYLSINQIINCSPEPQISRELKTNQIKLRHAGVFRSSSLNMLDSKIKKKLLNIPKNSLPVYIKEYSSPWVSLSKVPMLLAGNYRCIANGKLYSISDTIRFDLNKSELIYNQASNILKKLGAEKKHIIPFYKYLKSSINLNAPSSVCKSILQGNLQIERTDKLFQYIAKANKLQFNEIDDVVLNIERNIFRTKKDI